MMKSLSRKATQYIFFELLPPFILGLIVFIFILLMFQALRLTDFVLVHGVSLAVIGRIVLFLSISFLPALLPMSLLFAIIMTYGRLSQDSEIVAFKAAGLHMISILLPAVVLAVLVSFLSAQTSFYLAPWGNRQFELIVAKVGQSRAGISLKEGTFSEGFFDMVIYANEVDSKKGEMQKIFIYDERQVEMPLTVIAKRGQIVQDENNPGHSVLLRLYDGDIHRKTLNHTKIKFNAFDLHLYDPVQEEKKEKTPLSMTIDEIENKIQSGFMSEEDQRTFRTEWHKRWALAFVCPIFGLLGVGLGTTTNRRSQKNNGLVLSIGVVVLYWILYVSAEGVARSGQLPSQIAIWLPNFLFAAYAVWTLKKNWN